MVSGNPSLNISTVSESVSSVVTTSVESVLSLLPSSSGATEVLFERLQSSSKGLCPQRALKSLKPDVEIPF